MSERKKWKWKREESTWHRKGKGSQCILTWVTKWWHLKCDSIAMSQRQDMFLNHSRWHYIAGRNVLMSKQCLDIPLHQSLRVVSFCSLGSFLLSLNSETVVSTRGGILFHLNEFVSLEHTTTSSPFYKESIFYCYYFYCQVTRTRTGDNDTVNVIQVTQPRVN